MPALPPVRAPDFDPAQTHTDTGRALPPSADPSGPAPRPGPRTQRTGCHEREQTHPARPGPDPATARGRLAAGTRPYAMNA